MLRQLLPITASLAALVISAPGNAQDDAATAQQQELQRTKDQIEQTKAETDLVKARTDQVNAQIEALGLTRPEGKTTLEGEGGKIEGWMLASGTLTAAASAIDRAVSVPAGGKIVLLGSEDAIELRTSGMLREQFLSANERQQKVLLDAQCPDFDNAAMGAAALPVAAIGAVLSFLRSDTEISGFSLESGEKALLNAIAGTAPGKYIIPGDIASLQGTEGDTLSAFNSLVSRRHYVAACRNAIAANPGRGANATKTATARLAKLDASLAQTQAQIDAATDRENGKPSQLEQDALHESLKLGENNVLRIRVDKAGGSLLKRSNLFTMLGAPAVGVTGGAVVSWRLSRPADGVSLGGGILVCRTKLTNLKSIHAGKVAVDASSCSSNLAPPPKAEG